MKQLVAKLALLRGGHFDLTTVTGRSKERERRIVLSSIAAMFAKVLSVGVGLMTVPITLKYLGPERYGLWMAISSVIGMLRFADLGIGNGLLTAISKAHGNDDRDEIRKFFVSSAVFLSGIACIILAGFAVAYPWISWAHVFNVHSSIAVSESGQAVAAFVLCFALNIPANLIQRLQLGLQMGFVSNLWQSAGSILSLIAVLVTVYLKAGLPWLVVSLSGAPIVAAVVNALYFFWKVRPDLLPRFAEISWGAATQVARVGVLFVILQIVMAVTYTSDNFIIARLLGITAVTEYAIAAKMFGVIPLILATVLTPLWPAYGEAIARKDRGWVIQVLKKSLAMSLLGSALVSGIFVVFGPQILALWVGKSVHVSFVLLCTFGVWKIIEAIGTALAVFLNGANVVRIQVVTGILTAAVAIVLKFVLISRFGVAGALWATIASYLVFSLLPYYFVRHKLMVG